MIPSKYQEKFYWTLKNTNYNIVLDAKAGSGKCHTKGTKILMYDGSIKNVENINIGELLMGDDSTPRKVLSLAKGKEMCYDIIPIKGDKFGINESHILVLRASYTYLKNKYVKNQIIELPFNEWLKLNRSEKHCLKLYKTKIKSKQKLSIGVDPYYVGLWLGDGCWDNAARVFVNEYKDKEISEYLYKYSKQLGLKIHRQKQQNSGNYVFLYSLTNTNTSIAAKNKNVLQTTLRNWGLITKDKNIPKEWIHLSIKDRKKLLAGYIDSDGGGGNGNGSDNGCYDVISKRKALTEQIALLARSVGYRVKITEKEIFWSGNAAKYIRKSDNKNRDKILKIYYRLSISGAYDLPVLTKRKKSTNLNKINKNCLNTGFNYKQIGIQKYYGFQLDGNGKYLLGDTTVTHNTTTLKTSLDYINPKATTLFIAFNNSIVNEMKEKIKRENTTISTIHGMGNRMLKKHFKCGAPNGSKYRTLANQMMDLIVEKETKHLEKLIEKGDFGEITAYRAYLAEREETRKEYINNALKLCDLLRQNLTDKWDEVAERYNIELINDEGNFAIELIKEGRKITSDIDFVDMLYLPIYYKLRPYKYDYVYVDESQDLNAAQRSLMLMHVKEKTGRFIAVGDKNQCQPPNTMILMNDGSKKPISEVKKGDKVVAYDCRERGGIVGYKKSKGFNVNKIASRPYIGKLYSITSGGKKSSYTPNHFCYVKFNKDDSLVNTGYCVYLMKKDDRFRIGISQLFGKSGMGVTHRFTQEAADCYWILKVVENRHTAQFWEYVYSVKYGIPDIVFKQRNKSENGFSFTQEQIDEYYSNFKNLKQKAKKLLNDFKLDINYPFYSRGQNKMGGRYKAIRLHACNLIPKLMVVGHFDESNRATKQKNGKKPHNTYPMPVWKQIDNIKVSNYSGLVYSLDIDIHHNYIADNIITNNCIYGFAGSDVESFAKLMRMPNTVILPLSCTYRCAKSITAYAQSIVPDIEAHENAPEGTLIMDGTVKSIEDGDMAICRTTFPLVKLCMDYLLKGRKAYIVGKDIGTNLINFVKKAKTDDVDEMFKFFHKEWEKLVEKVARKNKIDKEDAKTMQEVIVFDEKVMICNLLAAGEKTVSNIEQKIIKIFEDKSDGIKLSTIHKAKGLEADRVHILQPELLPAPWAKQDWEKEQEMNLKYVAITRAKTYLNIVTDFDAYEDMRKKKKEKADNFDNFGQVLDKMAEKQMKEAIFIATGKRNDD